ncbi:MAG TPA: hypothetical protein VFF73_27970 [Planctomycetota bacterium]|nr:hypothetical protein [Planctomycetota bacterium]
MGLWGDITGAVGGAVSTVGDVASTGLKVVGDAASGVVNGGADLVSGVASGDPLGGIENAASDLENAGASATSDLVSGAIQTAKDGWGAITSAADLAYNYLPLLPLPLPLSFFVHHWKAVIATVVAVAATAAVIALLPEGLAGLALVGGLLLAGAAGGIASSSVGDLLDGKDPISDWKHVLLSGAIGGVLTVATAGLFGAFSGAGAASATGADGTATVAGAAAGDDAGSAADAVAGRAGDDPSGTTGNDSSDPAAKGGAARAAANGESWKPASVDDAVSRLGPREDVQVTTTDQKVVFTNTKTGESVVYDPAGNYFRIQGADGRYLDLNGQPISNKVPVLDENGDPVLNARGNPKLQQLSGKAWNDYYQSQTHFASSASQDQALALAREYGLTTTSDSTAAGGATSTSDSTASTSDSTASSGAPSSTHGFTGALGGPN